MYLIIIGLLQVISRSVISNLQSLLTGSTPVFPVLDNDAELVAHVLCDQEVYLVLNKGQ